MILTISGGENKIMDAKTLKANIQKELKNLHKEDLGLAEGVNIVLTIIIMLIVGVIGLFIGDKVLTVAGTFTNTDLTNATNSLTSTVSTGFSFLVILVVAAIGGIALSYVMYYMGGALGGGKQGGAM